MPNFDTQHGSIYYEVLNATGRPAGAAPDLMLLHNFMSTGRATWGPMLDSLFLRYRILLPDLPGHGRSIGHPEGFDHGIIAQQLAALMHAVGAADGHLAGCSSGGMIAQLLMHHRLVNPASLILVSTTYSTNPHVIGALGMAPENFTANDTWLEATARLHDPYRYAGYYADVLLPGFRHLSPTTTIDLTLDAVAAWTLPVCLIHGERDELFPLEIIDEMAWLLPRSELRIVQNQSHALIFRQSWRVLAKMQAFLQRQTTPD